MKNYQLLSIVFIASLFTLASCHKEGSGGKAGLSGTVKHHTMPIPNCVVYIKYGATELPGTDISKYDDHVTTDANANYEIKDLYKGDYYLYGVGFDPVFGTLTGGIFVKIKKNKTYSVDVPVTE